MIHSAIRQFTTSALKMSASKLTIACGQMCSSSNLAANARVATKLIDQAVAKNVKVLFLPEAADYISRDAAHSVQLANDSKDKFINVLQNHVRAIHDRAEGNAQEKGIFVAVGVHEPAEGANKGKKVRNNQLWIDNRGEIAHTYQKLHLFDINIPNGPILKELNSVEPGQEILPPFKINEGEFAKFSVGLAICYDIRFNEMALRLRRLGANIITFPSAFTTRTGEAHWLKLGKARAIDSQCYVVMAAQCGEHDVYADVEENTAEGKKVRVSYGQSVIIGPWGEVVAKGDTYLERPQEEKEYSQLIVGEIDLDYVEKIRRDLPVFTHRRPEIFGYEV